MLLTYFDQRYYSFNTIVHKFGKAIACIFLELLYAPDLLFQSLIVFSTVNCVNLCMKAMRNWVVQELHNFNLDVNYKKSTNPLRIKLVIE